MMSELMEFYNSLEEIPSSLLPSRNSFAGISIAIEIKASRE